MYIFCIFYILCIGSRKFEDILKNLKFVEKIVSMILSFRMNNVKNKAYEINNHTIQNSFHSNMHDLTTFPLKVCVWDLLLYYSCYNVNNYRNHFKCMVLRTWVVYIEWRCHIREIYVWLLMQNKQKFHVAVHSLMCTCNNQ